MPPPGSKRPAARPAAGITPFWLGLVVSIGWIGLVFLIVARSGPTHTFGGVPLVSWALGLSAIVSPVALVWMVTAYLQRATDIQAIVDPLRRQLTLVTGESGAAEARMRRFNQAIREQLELLRSTQELSQNDLAAIMDRVRQHRNDLERFEHSSIHQVKEIQDVIRRNMQHVEQMMDDKFTMLRILDEKLVKNSDGVARQTEAVRAQTEEMLRELESVTQTMAESLDRSLRDTKKLSDTTRMQEASLITAAESAAETLNGVSSKIDLTIARFLERTGSAREEAERLAGTLDAQTRSLDEFSNMLPARVSEAEAIIRGVADRLYASEQMARDQAVNLSERLSQQVDGLHQFMNQFGARLVAIDDTMSQRRNDLSGLVGRIDSTAAEFTSAWEKSINTLSERTDNTLLRFTVINDESRRNAEVIAGHLSETTVKYEEAAARIRVVSKEGNEELAAMTQEIARHLSQFEALRVASQQAGEEVQTRSSAALQNLQYVLERLLAAREATQTVGASLTKDLHGAVDQNEQLIVRLNEAAQMSVRALAIAGETLGKKEGEMATQARTAEAMLREAAVQLQQQAAISEKGLRDQAGGLMALLAEVQSQMITTDQKLRGFAAQAMAPVQQALQNLDANADKGIQALNGYGAGVNEQINRLQQFNDRIGTMSGELGRVTVETIGSIDQLNNRFTTVRSAQEETARQTLAQFADLAERLQREIAGLDSQTAQAAETLQQAALKVGEQSYKLLQDAQNSGTQMQMITGALQNEASQIRAILQKQTDDLGGDLSRAEKQFATLGDALKQRTDSAYALLDRIAAHYNETTRTAAQDLETRAQKLEQSATQAQGKVDTLNAALENQLGLIANGTTQLEAQASQIGAISGKTLQQLALVNEKLTVTNEASSSNAQQALTRIEECGTAFMRQSNALSEAAQNSVALIQRAGSAFNEQAGKMIETTSQADQNMRQLTAATTAMSDQSAQIRANMEQQNQRLIAQLTESVTQLQATDSKLQGTVASAVTGADHAAARLAEATNIASTKLTASHEQMSAIAGKTETMLTTLGTSLTNQTASLTLLNEQLDTQQRSLTAANENQRTQLVDLFEKLGAAHAQASEVAERSIVRLNESVQQIQRNLGALSDQSQATIGNVRAASEGFADQAGLLLQNASAAEQQARTVLSVTSALQDQARQLREAMHAEGDRTQDILSGLLGRITSGGAELRDVGTNTELALTSLHNAMEKQGGALTGVMSQMNERQRSLTIALDAQRDVINGLLNRLTLAQDEAAALAERTVSRLTDGSQQITRQIEALGSQAQTSLASIQAVNAGFADEAGSLSLHAQQAEQQVRGVLTVTAGLQDQARQIRESVQSETARVVEQLAGVIAQLDATQNQLKQHSGGALSSMDQVAQQFTALTRTASATVQKQADALSEATVAAETRMAAISDKMQTHLKLVTDAGAAAEQQTRQVADTAEYAVTRMAALRDTMASADKEGGTLLERATARIDDVRTALQNELQRLADLSQQAVQQVMGASQQLGTQSDVLRANLASSESALTSAADTIREESRQVPAIIDRSRVAIDGATAALHDKSKEAEAVLVGTADRFIAVTTTARESVADEMRRISQVADNAATILTQFNGSLSTQIQSLQHNTAIMSHEQQEMVARANDSVAQLTAASERLMNLRSDAATTAERLTREFDMLDQRTAATGQRLVAASDSMARNMEALAQVTERAEGQMLGASSSFREQLERIRTGVQGQVDDINRGLMQITAQLERTGSTLRATTAGTVADVERIAQRFDGTSKEAATQLTEKTLRMRTMTEEVGQLLNGFGDKLDVLLGRLSMAGDGIRRHEGDLIGQLQTALSHLSTVAERLEESRALTTNVSEQAISRLGDVVATVQQQMQNLTGTSQTAAGIMRGIGQIYSDQSEKLNRGVSDAHVQVQEMNKNIDEMQQRTDRMRVALKLQSEELMGSLQQILEQLSLSGDTFAEAVTNVLESRAKAG